MKRTPIAAALVSAALAAPAALAQESGMTDGPGLDAGSPTVTIENNNRTPEAVDEEAADALERTRTEIEPGAAVDIVPKPEESAEVDVGTAAGTEAAEELRESVGEPVGASETVKEKIGAD